MTDSIMNTYGRLPLSFSHGEGVWLYDQQGNQYLDAISGIAVNALGHCHPAVTQALTEQANALIHTSNLYNIAQQEKLADELCELSSMEKVFFCNSGAEANEAAIKIARSYGNKRGIEVPTVVVFSDAFHGRTLATLTASGSRKVQAGFEPLVRGFTRADYGDIEALQHIAKNNTDVVAVLIEPIQGEGGVNILPPGQLKQIRELCDQHQWLLMLDEVQTGNGRTGKYFAYQHEGIIPDVVTTAKGLGNGVPIGACLAQGIAAQTFAPGNHGSTFGGNPLACAAGLAVVKTLREQNLLENVHTVGAKMLSQFKQALIGQDAVVDIRGAGLMIGIELKYPCQELVSEAIEQGLLINVTAENTIRLLPPLIIDTEIADQIVDTVCKLVVDFQHRANAA